MSDEEKSPEIGPEDEATELSIDETEDPETLTGSSVHAVSVAASRGTHGFASGGMISSSGGWTSPSWTTYPSTGTGTSWGGTLTPPPSGAVAKRRVGKMVNLPPKFTKKILVAIIDPDEEDEMKNVIWAAQLEPVNWEVRSDGTDGRLLIEFSLEDVHGNIEED